MNYTPRLTLVVPRVKAPESGEVLAYLDPDSGGSETFSVPLSSDGQEPVTHFAAYSPILLEAYTALTGTNAALKAYTDVQPDKFYPNGDPVPRPTTGRVLSFKQGLVIEDVDNLVGFNAFITSLGLQRIEPQEI